MTTSSDVDGPIAPPPIEASATMPDRARHRADVRRFLAPENASVLYIYVIGFIIFAIWIPDLWLSFETHRSILNISFPIPALVAVGLVRHCWRVRSTSRSPG